MNKIGKVLKVILLLVIGINFVTRACRAEMKINDLKIIGHRGASGLAPENTIESFKMASTVGMWGVEADVYTLSDGNLIIFHDEELQRMTNGCGRIQDMSLNDIKKLKIISGTNIEAYSNIGIPTFEEYIECCSERNLVPVIDLKKIDSKSIKKIVEVVKKNGLEEKTIIISTDCRWIKEIRKYSEKIQFQYLSDISVNELNKIKSYGNFGMDVKEVNITEDKVILAHKHGAVVNVWDVKTKERYDELKVMGVDMITSNYIFEK